MRSASDIIVMVTKAYQEVATTGTKDVIVFVMDNSSPLGRFISSNLPSVALGIDRVRKDEMGIAAFPAKAALELLKRASAKQDLGDLTPLTKQPPSGHFWVVGFGWGKQMAPFPIPK
jgi:hypothetical protein